MNETNFIQTMVNNQIKFERPSFFTYLSKKLCTEPVLFFAVFVLLPYMIFLIFYLEALK